MDFTHDSHWLAPLSESERQFIRGLPKTEHHLHLEGATPYHRLRALRPDSFPEVTPVHWSPHFRYPDFASFLEVLGGAAKEWYLSPERYALAASDLFSRAQRETVSYMEVSIDAFCVNYAGCGVAEVAEAILAVVPDGMTVRIFLGMTRNALDIGLGPTVRPALDCEAITGFDLHGFETLPIQPWADTLWEASREAGKINKAHAGEFGPAGNVREVVDRLGVARVQHGVRAVEDPALLASLAQAGVGFDVCPISNVKLKVVASPEEHPLRAIIAAGVPCTISTDDPYNFHNTISDEYALLAVHLGFTRDELAEVARTGFRQALLPESQRAVALRAVDDHLSH